MPKPISSSQLVEVIREYTGYVCQGGPASDRFRLPDPRDSRLSIRPSARKKQQDCVSIEESIQLAAGKADLAEELFSMLLEQMRFDHDRVEELWQDQDLDGLLDCVHKLHGATRYCGVPELRTAANRLETALKREAPDLGHHKEQLVSAMERLQIWSDQTDWQQLFREQSPQAETT
ncbi:Hpt domain-containing protein [Marinobacter salinisoli]